MESAHPFYQPEHVKKLTIIIPTLNEVDNIGPLISRLERTLRPISWSALFVDDDSTDGTYDLIKTLAFNRPHIQAIRRIGRKGLSSACIEGMAMATSAYIAVMDADLQHDEHLLQPMLTLMERDRLDLVAASRFLRGGSVGPLSARRALMSRTANALSARLCGVRLSDPMSGFFMLRRALFHEVYRGLSGHGTKILLDILTAARRPVQCAELPLRFRERLSGESKLDAQVMWEFLYLLSQKTLRRLIPPLADRVAWPPH
ncbi:MAG: polyprenol monophosphomannose synthase [Alphaproteobacteria bacterium]|nr:polyprenol monophosphomannose synthase [Alphaproteobacteria bacterium]